MRTLAEEILTNNRSFVEELAVEYPTYFDTNNLTITQDNYFLVVSKYRLGTAQTHQFQSGEQYGANWHWGSKCTEDNGTITCDDSVTPANNALAEIGREYLSDNGSTGAHYNWYVAVAESKSYNAALGSAAEDSICPKGWGLASRAKTNDLTVAVRNYDSESYPLAFRKMPIMFTLTGSIAVYFTNLPSASSNSSSHWTSSVGTYEGTATQLFLGANGAGSSGLSSTLMSVGQSIRCVKD